ncbi:MAG: hypothetical protein GX849_08885 [Clostridiaceae bacterium]|nr:hypothetical protein [Clostridiaceae bacterium]
MKRLLSIIMAMLMAISLLSLGFSKMVFAAWGTDFTSVESYYLLEGATSSNGKTSANLAWYHAGNLYIAAIERTDKAIEKLEFTTQSNESKTISSSSQMERASVAAYASEDGSALIFSGRSFLGKEFRGGQNPDDQPAAWVVFNLGDMQLSDRIKLSLTTSAGGFDVKAENFNTSVTEPSPPITSSTTTTTTTTVAETTTSTSAPTTTTTTTQPPASEETTTTSVATTTTESSTTTVDETRTSTPADTTTTTSTQPPASEETTTTLAETGIIQTSSTTSHDEVVAGDEDEILEGDEDEKGLDAPVTGELPPILYILAGLLMLTFAIVSLIKGKAGLRKN